MKIQQKKEYQYLHKKDNELKSDDIENEGVVEYRIDFINCKSIHGRNSTKNLILIILMDILIISNYYFQ